MMIKHSVIALCALGVIGSGIAFEVKDVYMTTADSKLGNDAGFTKKSPTVIMITEPDKAIVKTGINKTYHETFRKKGLEKGAFVVDYKLAHRPIRVRQYMTPTNNDKRTYKVMYNFYDKNGNLIGKAYGRAKKLKKV